MEDQKPVQYTDYRLRSLSSPDRAGKRYHVMRFVSKQNVDPTTFQQPVTMHRRDPRALRYQQAAAAAADANNGTASESVIEVTNNGSNTSHKMAGTATSADSNDNGIKQEGDVSQQVKVVDEHQPTVAPDVPSSFGSSNRNLKRFQKKTRQVFTGHEEERRLRYEEYYPWLIEDFDGKNTWVGNYEAAQSDSYVLFVFDEDGFKMVPAEKWYKFTPRNKYATLSLDEAEAILAKKNQPPRWLMKHLRPDSDTDIKNENGETDIQGNGNLNTRTVVEPPKKKLKTVAGSTSRRGSARRGEYDDTDELDFDEEFADDEEAPIMEGPEEESKEVELRMKRQMRSKNTEDDVDGSDFEDQRRIGKEGRKLKQSLRSLEQNAIYESDDDDDEDENLFGDKTIF
ncbi:hypothetical protein V1511DRAFT_505875 [Dipodascopsis uninucleata]